ncbi:MAG: mechanosensitive ion channel [Lachnospiraceae bacterium]|nr:mechanosensitive ion channel [Lachnospiraceae bacterium]
MLLVQAISDNFIKDLEDGVLRRWLEAELPKALGFFWTIVLAFVVYFIGAKIIKGLRKGLRKSLEFKKTDIGVVHFVDQVLKVVGYAVLILIILHLFGFEATSLSAAIASVGVTAGLAFQGSLSNFAGGVLILILHPFRIGDYIVEDTHKNEGTVIEISIFYTKLKTLDNKIVVIPNGILANSSLTNITDQDKRMINLIASIGYNDDIDAAKAVIQKIIDEEPEVIRTEDIKIFVQELGASSVDIGFRFYVPMNEYWNVRWRTLERVKKEFDAAGITIPFQQLDVHINQ